jgi:hypothetical protein
MTVLSCDQPQHLLSYCVVASLMVYHALRRMLSSCNTLHAASRLLITSTSPHPAGCQGSGLRLQAEADCGQGCAAMGHPGVSRARQGRAAPSNMGGGEQQQQHGGTSVWRWLQQCGARQAVGLKMTSNPVQQRSVHSRASKQTCACCVCSSFSPM